MNKFKIGDRVVTTGHTDTRLKPGMIGVITEDDNYNPWTHFEGEHRGKSGSGHCKDSCYAMGMSEIKAAPDITTETTSTTSASAALTEQSMLEAFEASANSQVAEWQSQIYPWSSYSLATRLWNNKPIKEEKSKNMSETTKMYRVLKDTTYATEGAILKREASNYEAIADYWDTPATERARKAGSRPAFTVYEVEDNPEWFERVYEISRLGKLVYATKEMAVKEAAKLFKSK